jgi:hypothetical protein
MNNRMLQGVVVSFAWLLAAGVVHAQVPAGSTGMCGDGSYTSAKSEQGACSGHGGVKTWYGSAKTAPAGSTGMCGDGSYTSAKNEQGACSGHGGVKTWFADAKPAAAAPAAKATAPAAKTTAPASAAADGKAKTSPKATEKTSEMPKVAAPGGGPGKVWVNTSSNVYHCATDEWYGKTKQGAYMTEAQAKAKGAHAAGGKGCG